MSIGRLGAVIWLRWTIFCGEPLRISVTLIIQRRLRPWKAKSKLPFMGLMLKQSKMYWKIGLIEWGTVRPAVADVWMIFCFILKWKGSIFLIKPYFLNNIHKFFYSRFKFQMLDGPPCSISVSSFYSLLNQKMNFFNAICSQYSSHFEIMSLFFYFFKLWFRFYSLSLFCKITIFLVIHSWPVYTS